MARDVAHAMRFPCSLSSLRTLAWSLALPAAWLALQPAPATAAVTRERLAASATSLVVDKVPVGTLRSSAGGSAVATVATTSLGPDNVQKKHISAVTYEDLELEIDLSLDRSLYDWIGAAFAGQAPRKSGALTSFDATGSARGTREFQNALISEVILPTFDGSSKEAGYITLLLAPERVSNVASSGGKAGSFGAKTKAWLTSNFRLEIDGLDTTRVSRVEGLHFKQTIAGSVGSARDPSKHAAGIQLDNFRVTLAEAGADSWRNWHEDFVVKGNSSDKSERSGRMVLLAANLKDELARIELSNLGIVALRPRASATGVSQLEAELYVERMGFTLGGK